VFCAIALAIAHQVVMPGPSSKSGQALFLGLELSTDQLRATIVDENLELVGVEAVDFDTALSEYQ
jgi:xylulokinase